MIDVVIGFIDDPDTGTIIAADDAWALVVVGDNEAVDELGETTVRVSTVNELLNDDSQTRIVVSSSVQQL